VSSKWWESARGFQGKGQGLGVSDSQTRIDNVSAKGRETPAAGRGLAPEDAELTTIEVVGRTLAGPQRLTSRDLLRLQRTIGNSATSAILSHGTSSAHGSEHQTVQRDPALDPPAAVPAAIVLSPRAIQAAIRLNSVMFTDAPEIAIVRDVLGIAKEPSVVDEDFVNAVARYQASQRLTPDGMLGANTAAKLSDEITAEASRPGDPAHTRALRRVARRLHLRSMTSRRHGVMTHQGFVGPDDNPEGAITVRTGDRQAGGAGNQISTEYTGENANAVNFLQFINMQMFATPPGGGARVFNAGVVGTTGGPVTWSNAGTTHWFVDAIPGGSPLYDVSGGLNTRSGGRRIAVFDEPGGASGLPVAQAFAAPGAAAAGAVTVTMRMRFDTYEVRNNRARYHSSWSATTTYNIPAATSSAIAYTQGGAGQVASLTATHRAALLAEYAGNPIH
jgi:hypothetical protein